MSFDPIAGLTGGNPIAAIGNLLAGRPDPLPCSFRGVPFFEIETNDTFGRRVAVHQYPKYDIPYCEDMGRRAREFEIAGFVVGTDWEAKRNALLAACETPQIGTLQHPEFGDFHAICLTVAHKGSRLNHLFYCRFDMRFIESGDNKIPPVVVNPLLQVRAAIASAYALIKNVLTSVYILSKLPSTLKALLQSATGTATESARKIPSNAVQKAVAKLDATDIESKDVITYCMAIPQSVTADLVARDVRESSGGITAVLPVGDSAPITPYQAVSMLEDMIAAPVQLPIATTPLKAVTRQSVEAVQLAVKVTAAVEITRAVTYIDFQSLPEAYTAWGRVLAALDTVTTLARNAGHDQIVGALADHRALAHADIQARAPTLSRVKYVDQSSPESATMIAYRAYRDTSRASEVVARNRVRHPGFVASPRLELLINSDG